MNLTEARNIVGNKIIGITCHNSIKLAKTAIREKASYIAFGAFFSSKTKKVKFGLRFVKKDYTNIRRHLTILN